MLGAGRKSVGSFEFRQAPLGAGGFVTGLDISADGSRMIHWTDAWNGYIRDKGADRWDLLLRADNMIRAEWSDFGRSPSHDNGVYAGRIAPSNKDVIYCAWHGFIYKTTDGGAHWARTAFAPKLMESNMGPQRRFTRVLDVHPTDPDTVILGTNGDGVYYTTNGGTSWTAVGGLAPPAVTLGAPSKYLVAFDPGQPAMVYIHVVGTGLYRSTTGVGGTFSLLSGSPLNASRLLVTAAGKVYVVKYREGGTSRLVSLDRGATGWTTIGNNPNADQVAVNPLNLNHIVTVDEDGGTFRQSYDGGVNWVQAYVNGAANAWQWTRGDGETKWFSNRAKPMFPAMLLFDPVVNGKLWVAEGIGIGWSMCPPKGVAPTNAKPWIWHDFSRGNEELIPNSIGSSPGNPVILACWDKPFWRMDDTRDWTNMWSYPVPAGEAFNEGVVTVGYCTDYAADDHKFLVGVVGQGGNQDGYSTDGGRTWTKFANPCAGFGGWVAVSTRLNFIRTATNNGPAQYTLDGGKTWRNVAFGGNDPVIGWAPAYYVVRQNITADKTRPGVFAAILNNMHPTIPNTLGNPNGGVWLTKDGGQTWTHRCKGAVNVALGGGRQEQFWQGSLQYVPGKSGELLWADLAGGPDNRLGWSQDDGATWKQPHPAIRDVLGFGFGKGLPGQERPAVYLNCVIGGVRGIYASFDWFATPPILMVERPLNHIGGFGWTSGDLNVLGRCYVALSGHGFAVCDYAKRFALTAGSGRGSPDDDLIIVPLLGQSNMVGRSLPDGRETDISGIYAYVNDPAAPGHRTITSSINPLKFPEGKQDFGPSGMQYAVGPNQNLLAKMKAQHPTAKIVAVPCAVGATSLIGPSSVWKSSAVTGAGGIRFEAALAAVADARAKALAMFPGASIGYYTFWVQGENDAGAGVKAAYASALSAFISHWRARLAGGAHRKFVLGSLLPQKWIIGSGQYDGGFAEINAAHVAASLALPDVVYVPGPDVRGDNDNLHYGPLSANRVFGDRLGDSLVDVTGPNVTTAMNQGGFVGRKLSIQLAHDDPWGHATFEIRGGADSSRFEVSDPYIAPSLRWHKDDTGPVAGEYVVHVGARDGAGNYGPDRTITVNQAVPAVEPITVNAGEWYNLSGFSAATITADIKKGVNLFSFASPAGADQGARVSGTVNGNRMQVAGHAPGAGGGGTLAVLIYESAVDVPRATVTFQYGGMAFGGFGRHAWITGVDAIPTAVGGYGWANGTATPQRTPSLTVPPAGVQVALFMSNTAISGPSAGTATVSLDNHGGRLGEALVSRSTTGQCSVKGGGNFAASLALAFAKTG